MASRPFLVASVISVFVYAVLITGSILIGLDLFLD